MYDFSEAGDGDAAGDIILLKRDQLLYNFILALNLERATYCLPCHDVHIPMLLDAPVYVQQTHGDMIQDT